MCCFLVSIDHVSRLWEGMKRPRLACSCQGLLTGVDCVSKDLKGLAGYKTPVRFVIAVSLLHARSLYPAKKVRVVYLSIADCPRVRSCTRAFVPACIGAYEGRAAVASEPSQTRARAAAAPRLSPPVASAGDLEAPPTKDRHAHIARVHAD